MRSVRRSSAAHAPVRIGLVIVALLSIAQGVAALRAQVRRPATAPVSPTAASTVPTVSSGAAGWKAIVRVVPNPLPAGRCAGISVEAQDPDGYRVTTLSNGQFIDFHHFNYQSTDLTSFAWQNGDPISGYICANTTATAAHTTLTVTLPDGTAGSVDISTIPPGQSAPAYQYPPQAAIRPHGVAPTYTLPTASSASAGARAPSAQPTVAAQHPPTIVTAGTFAMVGTYKSLSITVPAAMLAMTGTYKRLSVAVPTAALAMAGTYRMVSVSVTAASLTMAGTHPASASNPIPSQTGTQIPVSPQPHTP